VVLRFFLQVQNSFNAKDIAQAQSVIRGKKKEEQKNSIANQTRITPDIIHWVVTLPRKQRKMPLIKPIKIWWQPVWSGNICVIHWKEQVTLQSDSSSITQVTENFTPSSSAEVPLKIASFPLCSRSFNAHIKIVRSIPWSSGV